MKAFGSRRSQRYIAPDGGEIITDGLRARWPFEEGPGATTTADTSGNGHTATLVGMPDWVSGRFSDYALDFNGTTDYVSIPDGALVQYSQRRTICMWLYTRDNSAFKMYFSYGAAANYQGFTGEIGREADGRLSLNYYGGVVSEPGASITENAWQLVTLQFDSSNVIAWVDNTKVIDSVIPLDSAASNGSIGQRTYATPFYFNGLIDDVRIYTRVLTPEEIASIVAGTG